MSGLAGVWAAGASADGTRASAGGVSAGELEHWGAAGVCFPAATKAEFPVLAGYPALRLPESSVSAAAVAELRGVWASAEAA